MKTTTTIIGIGALIAIVIMMTNRNPLDKSDVSPDTSVAQNVSIVDGIQIVEIKVKGGYIPRVSVAKADMSTRIRFNTSGTFDCSSSVRISSMNISKSLPVSGSTDIDLGTQKAGILKGSCGMGMYPFEIEFK